jgi:hypothetical protein
MCYSCANKRKIFMATSPKTKFLSTRVRPDTHKKFHVKARKYGQPSDVLRELVDAFIDDRIKIQPPVTVKESLYHVS